MIYFLTIKKIPGLHAQVSFYLVRGTIIIYVIWYNFSNYS